jgi:hypothetical protein
MQASSSRWQLPLHDLTILHQVPIPDAWGVLQPLASSHFAGAHVQQLPAFMLPRAWG